MYFSLTGGLMERLDKYIADRTEMSRKDVKQLVRKGCVCIDGKVVSDASAKVETGSEVSVNGKKLRTNTNTYIMLNKPEGCVCSTKDSVSRTVLSYVPPTLKVKNLFPAGRLDKDSKGFVLLTDDGEFAHRILSPKKHLPKYYLVRLREKYNVKYEAAFLEGIVIDGNEKCLPARVSGIPENEKYAFIELHEGKFHQVKRMFEAVENAVESLYRTQIGGLAISPDLAPGECLELLNNDVEKMLSETVFTDVLETLQKSFWAYLINNDL